MVVVLLSEKGVLRLILVHAPQSGRCIKKQPFCDEFMMSGICIA